MNKITTTSAAALMALTLFGMAQPIVSHADQINNTPATHQDNIQNKATHIANLAFGLVTKDESHGFRSITVDSYGNLEYKIPQGPVTPFVDVTITKTDGTKIAVETPTTGGSSLDKNVLEAGDTITITAKEDLVDSTDGVYKTEGLNKGGTMILKVQADGSVLKDVDSTPVVFEDTVFETNIRAGLKIADGAPITQGDMKNLTSINSGNFTTYFANADQIKSLKGLEYATELATLSDYKNTGKLKDITFPDLSNMTKLASISLTGDALDNEAVKEMGTLKSKSTCNYELNGNNITNIEALNGSKSHTVTGQIVTETLQHVANGNLTLKVKDIKDIDGKTPAITPSDGGTYDSGTGTITWTGISKTELSYSWKSSDSKFAGKVTVPTTTKQSDTSSDLTVSYDYTAPTPADPGWYSVVPADVVFTDTNKDVDTTVKLVNADDQKTLYSGAKQVDVTVKSDNAYKLKDAANDAVEYQLDKDGKGGTFLDANDTEQLLGTLAKGTASSINSKAHLTGTATKTGKYIDTLHYVFKEK